MTIRVGTILELTGQGHEILVDAETRTVVLARLFNGAFEKAISVSTSADDTAVLV